MDDKSLYQTVLGLQHPWRVESVDLQLTEEQVLVRVGLAPDGVLHCPVCDAVCAGYDQADERRWRHLDTCQYHTILVSQIPRVRCAEHGVKQVRVPWAEERGRFTMLFETWAIRVLQECSIDAAAALLRTSWDEMAGIQARAVKRGMARRTTEPVRVLGVDETSFQKHHQYVTVLIDIEQDRVVWVGDDRKQATLRRGLETLPLEQRANLKAIVMDMWDPYIAATRDAIPNWQDKLVIDRYHVMWHMSKAVDDVRIMERRGDPDIRALLKGTRFLWLRGRATRKRKHSLALNELLKAGLKVGRAWAIKESLTALWEYKTIRGALRFFKNWYGWAIRSRLEPVKRTARMIRYYLRSIVSFTELRYTNARTEAMNAKIQEIKYRARGYRNRDNFRMAILFHCGRLDLNPR
ncbi:MAG: ISL3 family transposase [Longimicrobiales bacterium]